MLPRCWPERSALERGMAVPAAMSRTQCSLSDKGISHNAAHTTGPGPPCLPLHIQLTCCCKLQVVRRRLHVGQQLVAAADIVVEHLRELTNAFQFQQTHLPAVQTCRSLWCWPKPAVSATLHW